MRFAFVAVPLALLAGPAFAQEVPGDFTLSGDVGIVSDYRYRGISQSGEEPSLQGSLTLDHASGLYGSLQLSTLGDAPVVGDLEIEGAVGYETGIGSGTRIDIGLAYNLYPDAVSGAATDYFEPYASLSHTLGPVTGTLGAAYAWEQAATGDDWLYLYGELGAAIPGTPVSLRARVGHQDYGIGGEHWEWELGATASFGRFIAGLAYVDTDLGPGRDVDPALVASLRFGF